MTCTVCHRRMKGRSDRKTCSHACRQKAYELRKKRQWGTDTWMERYTPDSYVQSVRSVLGVIDLDPASCLQANTVVQALRIFTKEEDGLSHPWAGRVYTNPPYRGLQVPFLLKLLDHYRAGEVTSAIALAPHTDSSGMRGYWEEFDAICWTSKRVRFWSPDGTFSGAGWTPSVFAYLGPNRDLFEEEFKKWGMVRAA